MEGSWIAAQFYHFIRGWFSMKKTFLFWSMLASGSLLFITCLQTMPRKEFSPPILMWSSLRTKVQHGKYNKFYFYFFFSLTSCIPDGPASFGLAFLAKNNYLQSILLPEGRPTTCLTYSVGNPGQIILMKIQAKMVNWKIYMCCCLKTKAL